MPSQVASPESASLSAPLFEPGSLATATRFEIPQKTSQAAPSDRPMTSHQPTAEQQDFVERLKRLYKADHQAEILVLQAEVDSLLLELESRKAAHSHN